MRRKGEINQEEKHKNRKGQINSKDEGKREREREREIEREREPVRVSEGGRYTHKINPKIPLLERQYEQAITFN